jgi:hypothetical protein
MQASCGSHSTCGAQQVRHKTALSWSQLHRASRLAHWSGFCYLPWDELPAAVEAENLSLVACGRTKFTSWWGVGMLAAHHMHSSMRHPTMPSTCPDVRQRSHRTSCIASVHNVWPANQHDRLEYLPSKIRDVVLQPPCRSESPHILCNPYPSIMQLTYMPLSSPHHASFRHIRMWSVDPAA